VNKGLRQVTLPVNNMNSVEPSFLDETAQHAQQMNFAKPFFADDGKESGR
jgi:hypothetical protein